MMPQTGVPPQDQNFMVNHSKVEIGIKCNGLINKDVLSLSDPIAFLYQRANRNQNWAFVGRTEMIKNNLNPEFSTKIVMDYMFESIQQLRVEIYDVDDEKHLADKSKHDFLGSAETDLGSVIASDGGMETLVLQYTDKSKKAGTVTIMATELKECSNIMELRLRCHKLAKKNTFNSDPFFTIERNRKHSQYEIIYTSEFYKKNLNPAFNPVNISLMSLCGGDKDKKIRFKIWDWERKGDHNLIGIFEKSVNELCKTSEFDLFNPESKKEKNRTKSQGKVIIDSCKVIHRPSFIEYVRSGLKLHLSVAIDFTGSNGDPRNVNSLHYMDPSGAPNQYVQAIGAVTDIITKYIGNDEIIASGFGAIILPAQEPSHLFPLDVDTGNYIVHGVPELINKYAAVLPRLRLYGPTNFAPTINSAITMANQLKNDKPYDFLVQLIITDGEISDLSNTIKAVIEASNTPMSIIIIGVGGADFSNMDRLDADDGRLRSDGRIQQFDNVQFVPFRDYLGRPYELAAQVLAELPEQVVEYMKLHGIKPEVTVD